MIEAAMIPTNGTANANGNKKDTIFFKNGNIDASTPAIIVKTNGANNEITITKEYRLNPCGMGTSIG